MSAAPLLDFPPPTSPDVNGTYDVVEAAGSLIDHMGMPDEFQLQWFEHTRRLHLVGTVGRGAVGVELGVPPDNDAAVELVNVVVPLRDGNRTITVPFASPVRWWGLPVGGEAAVDSTDGTLALAVQRPSETRWVFEIVTADGEASAPERFVVELTLASLAVPWGSVAFRLEIDIEGVRDYVHIVLVRRGDSP